MNAPRRRHHAGKLLAAGCPLQLCCSLPSSPCVEASLERLRTPYIDLFYTHAWDEGTPLQETLSTLNSLQEAGKVIARAN